MQYIMFDASVTQFWKFLYVKFICSFFFDFLIIFILIFYVCALADVMLELGLK